MTAKVYENAKYHLLANSTITPEGIGYYELVNTATNIIEARISLLPDAISLADECSDYLQERESKLAKVKPMKTKH